jgi:hypothetical protein
MGATRRSCLELKTANRRELAVERAAKKEAVEQLHEVFKTTGVAVVAHYSGLTVAQMQKLRMQMKQAGASVLAFQKPDAIGDYSSPRDIRKGRSKGREALIALARNTGRGLPARWKVSILSETAGALRGN